MPVPQEYLSVIRPKNTICKMIGNKCAVIQRIGCKRVNGKNIPINGPVIGHIIDGKYVEKKSKKLEVTLKNYADFIFADNIANELLDDLKTVYGDEIAIKIYVISLLRAINKGLCDYQIEDAYESSYISETYKDISLNKSTISNFINDLGKDYSKILDFMHKRVEKIDEDDLVAIDGMLTANNSKVNSLSDFSFKSKMKNSKEISQIVAFSIKKKEVICSLPYPGNTVDIVSFPDFIKKVGLKKGITLTDKAGADIADIGYIHPLKRNLKILDELKLYDMNEKLESKENAIQCKKASFDGKFYYAYRDVRRASIEKAVYMRSKKYRLAILNKKENKFGTVVYVSDQDISLDEAYKIYKQRREIELVNKYYNNELCLNVREHDDFSVYGTQFLNMLSMIIGNKMKNRFEELGLFEKYTFGELMNVLKRGKKVKDPRNSDFWLDTTQSKKGKEILAKLGI